MALAPVPGFDCRLASDLPPIALGCSRRVCVVCHCVFFHFGTPPFFKGTAFPPLLANLFSLLSSSSAIPHSNPFVVGNSLLLFSPCNSNSLKGICPYSSRFCVPPFVCEFPHTYYHRAHPRPTASVGNWNQPTTAANGSVTMKSFALLSALAAVAVATPTKAVSQAPTKRSNLPPVTVSGNGQYIVGGGIVCPL